MKFDPSQVRGQFPALNQKIKGKAPVFLDGPGGTQMPSAVTDAIKNYLKLGNANLHKSPFFAVENTHKVVAEARKSAASFVNGTPDEMVFGNNMSTITAHISRSISRDWKAGDEIILTDLDHSANVSYWKLAAKDKGVKVKILPVIPGECTIDYSKLEKLVSKKTKLIAFGLASNVCGTLSEPMKIMKAAKSVGALTFVDAVHYSPHFLPDVKKLGCDFLVCSAYKFFGPHLGFLYGKKKHLERMEAYKVEPAPLTGPEKWETGTKNFEALAGFNACIEYIASLGKGASLRKRLESSYDNVAAYEKEWSRKFLSRARGVKGMTIHGITDPKRAGQRTATFALTFKGKTPQEVSDNLARRNISTGAGSFYGIGVTGALGFKDKGGVMRAGCVHYNTFGEIEKLFEVIG